VGHAFLSQYRVVLGKPGFAWENEEGEPALRLDEEKVFSPETYYVGPTENLDRRL
jgi:hypothetical protein